MANAGRAELEPFGTEGVEGDETVGDRFDEDGEEMLLCCEGVELVEHTAVANRWTRTVPAELTAVSPEASSDEKEQQLTVFASVEA